MFDVTPLPIPDVLVITPKRFGDDRGFFSTVWQKAFFEDQGLVAAYDFDAFSYSQSPLTLRGLHFQKPPNPQTKLVRALRGAIYDAVVDIRKDSPTFGQWAAETLTADNGKMLYVPDGFAHGFLTLERDTEVAYKIRGAYSPDDEGGLLWHDADIGIPWPLGGKTPDSNDRDAAFPGLADFQSPF